MLLFIDSSANERNERIAEGSRLCLLTGPCVAPPIDSIANEICLRWSLSKQKGPPLFIGSYGGKDKDMDIRAKLVKGKEQNLAFPTKRQNIAKGTIDPRVEFISQVQTKILINLHLQNLDQASTSKSQPNISLSIKLQNLDQT